MKRKDYEDKYEDFSSFYLSSPSAKSRRLDPDLLTFTNEDSITSGVADSGVVESLKSSSLSSTTDVLGCNEKALVLYNPINTPLFKSPTSPDFSVIVNSDLIPGLKDQFILLGNSKKDALSMAKDKITCIADDRLALVPWVAARAEPQATSVETEEVEMMDTDDDSGGSGRAAIQAEGAGGLQQWQQQQHCMRPELVQNTCTPVTW